MMNGVYLRLYYSLTDLRNASDEFIVFYNNEGYYKSLENCANASVYSGIHRNIFNILQILKKVNNATKNQPHDLPYLKKPYLAPKLKVQLV